MRTADASSICGLLTFQILCPRLRNSSVTSRCNSVAIDWRVLAFAATAGLVSAALFGAIPAWRGSRPDVMQVLRGGGRPAGSPSGRSLRSAVVIAEIALSFVLLIGSGLMFRSFLALRRIDPGYDSRGVLTFQTNPPGPAPSTGRAERRWSVPRVSW